MYIHMRVPACLHTSCQTSRLEIGCGYFAISSYFPLTSCVHFLLFMHFSDCNALHKLSADEVSDSNYRFRPSPRVKVHSEGKEDKRRQSRPQEMGSIGTSHLNMSLSTQSRAFAEPIDDVTKLREDLGGTRAIPGSSNIGTGREHLQGNDDFIDDNDDDDDDDDFWYEETLDRDSNKDHSHGGGAFKGTANNRNSNLIKKSMSHK